ADCRNHHWPLGVIGSEVRGQHLQFRRHIYLRIDRLPAVAAWVDNVRAVGSDIQRGGAKAIGGETAYRAAAGALLLSIKGGRRKRARLREAWQDFYELRGVLALDLHVLHQLGADDNGLLAGIDGCNRLGRGADHNRFRRSAYLKRQVRQIAPVARIEVDSRPLELLKSLRFDQDGVVAGRNGVDGEEPVIISNGPPFIAAVHVLQCDGSPGNDRARRIVNGAG